MVIANSLALAPGCSVALPIWVAGSLTLEHDACSAFGIVQQLIDLDLSGCLQNEVRDPVRLRVVLCPHPCK